MRAIFLLLALCRLSCSIIIGQQSDSVDLFGNVEPLEALSADKSLPELLTEIEQPYSKNIDNEFEDAELPSSEEEIPNNDSLFAELFVNEFFADSGLDSVVDKALDEANKKIKEKQQHERKLPDVTPSFVKELFGTAVTVEFSAKDGLAFDLSTLQRTGPSSLVSFQLDGTVTVNVSVGLNVAAIAYQSCQLTLLNQVTDAGKLTANLKENSVTVQIELKLRQCETNLKSLTIDKLSNLQLHLSGLNKFTNWMANNVANKLLRTSQESVKKFLQPHLFKSAEETLKLIDICKFWSS